MNNSPATLDPRYRQIGEIVLESMFFEALAAEPFESPKPPNPVRCSRVEFEGSKHGFVDVAVEPALLEQLATNFLGLEEPANEEQQLDTLRELANIYCGSLMSHLVPGGNLRLSAPELISADDTGSGPWLTLPLEIGALAVHVKEAA